MIHVEGNGEAPPGWQEVHVDDETADAPHVDPIVPFSWPALDGREPPRRQFIVEEWIPRACVTSLYGPGGIGESLVAQLLGTTAATGRYWFGFPTEKCRVLALFCEDDEAELWRRQVRINAALDLTMLDLGQFLPDARVGRENALAWTEGTRLVAAPLLDALRAKVAELRTDLLILDNIAQMFRRQRERHRSACDSCSSNMHSPASRANLTARWFVIGHIRQVTRGSDLLGIDGMGRCGPLAPAPRADRSRPRRAEAPAFARQVELRCPGRGGVGVA